MKKFSALTRILAFSLVMCLSVAFFNVMPAGLSAEETETVTTGVSTVPAVTYLASEATVVKTVVSDKNWTTATTKDGYFIHDSGNLNGYVEYSVNVEKAGEYIFALRYNSNNNREIYLEVNGVDYGTLTVLDTSAAWHDLAPFMFFKATLNEGLNSIKLIRNSQAYPCIGDLVVYSADGWYTPSDNPVLDGTMAAKDTYPTAIDGIAFDTGNNSLGSVAWTVDIPVSGTYKMLVPYSTSSVNEHTIVATVDGTQVAEIGYKVPKTSLAAYGSGWGVLTTETFHLDTAEDAEFKFSLYGGKFLNSFCLVLVEADPEPETADATVTATVAEKDATVRLLGDGVDMSAASVNGTVSFELKDLAEGTHTYTMQITDEDAAGWIYDNDIKTVTIVVEDGKAEVSYAPDNAFTNEYNADPANVTFEVFVTLDGREMIDNEFSLVIGEDEIPVEGGKVSWTSTYVAAGVYEIPVVQKDTGKGGVTYDLEPKTITVNVTDENGQLVATVEGNNATFTNTYKAEVKEDLTVDVTVTLSDRTLAEGEITVILTGNGKEYIAMNGADGKVLFTIPAADVVAGTYTLSQSTDVKGIDLANAQTFTVVLDDNDAGELVAEAVAPITFKNVYKVPFAANGVIDGDYFKVDGVPTEMGLFEHEGAYYYAQYDGKIIKSQKYYVWLLSDNCGDMTEGWYAFDAEGKVVENGMFTDSEGTTWYYENYAPKEKGLFKYNGEYYVAQYDGKIITSKSYEYNEVGGKYYVWLVDDSAADIGKGWRYFDENGLMLQGIQDHPEKGGKYYFVNGQAKEKGLFYYEGDNNYYVAQYDGKIITNSKYYVWLVDGSAETIGKGWRYFDENGLMLQGIQDHPEKEGKYYFVNGQPKEMGLFLNEADGFYYVAQYDGKIITADNYATAGVKGKYYVWKTTNCDNLKGWQIFGADGKMIVPAE